MDKYTIAPPSGSTNNSVGASDRPWKEGHFEKLPNWQEYLVESTGYGIVSGCEPSISGLTVTVAAGVVHLADGTRKEIAETSITLDSADPTNPRIDLVYIDSTGAVAKVTGTAAASPSAPTLPTGGISVAQVSVAAGATTGTVTDSRDILLRFYNTGIVNVKDFGAVGDGVTDDTAAIQAAIDYAELQSGRNITIIIPFVCKVQTLYLSNNGDGWFRKQLVFTGGGGFYSEEDFLFERKQNHSGYVGNLVFYNIRFHSTGGNGHAIMTGYPFIRCKFICCNFYQIDHVILAETADSYVQSMYIDSCIFTGGRNYIIKLVAGSDIRFNNCIVEAYYSGVLYQIKGNAIVAFITNNAIEGINDCDEVIYFSRGTLVLEGNGFEAIPYLVNMELTGSAQVSIVNNAFAYEPRKTAWNRLSKDSNTTAIAARETVINFENNYYRNAPLIDNNINFTDDILAMDAGPSKILRFAGNKSIGVTSIYTIDAQNNTRTRSEMEFTGSLPFAVSSNGYYAMFSSDHIYTGAVNGIAFITDNGLTYYAVSQTITVNANATTIYDITLPFKAPNNYSLILDNFTQLGVELLSHSFTPDRTIIKVKLKNTTSTNATGILKINLSERIPVFA